MSKRKFTRKSFSHADFAKALTKAVLRLDDDLPQTVSTAFGKLVKAYRTYLMVMTLAEMHDLTKDILPLDYLNAVQDYADNSAEFTQVITDSIKKVCDEM